MKSSKNAFPLFLGLLALISCSNYPDDHGYVLHPENLEKIQIGETDKDEVKKLLGSPSTQSDYGNEKWFYIGKKATAVAFFEPVTSEQNILTLEFDSNGKVDKIEHYTLQDSENIQPVQDVTATEGNKLGLMEQLLGNLGRFNSGGNKKPIP